MSYFTSLTEANEFFEANRPIYAEYKLLSDPKKLTFLTSSYNRIFHGSGYSLPTLSEASTADLFILQLAQMEMTVYATIHLEDEDSRMGIRAQGVIEADIVGEKYNSIAEMPIPLIIQNYLKPWKDSLISGGVGAVDIARDDDLTVNSNPSGF